MCTCANNNECRAAIGHAGAMPALVNKLTLHGVEGETPAHVRIVGPLTNLVSVAENCYRAVECGVLMRFIHLTEATASPREAARLVRISSRLARSSSSSLSHCGVASRCVVRA